VSFPKNLGSLSGEAKSASFKSASSASATASTRRLFRVLMMVAPLRVANLADNVAGNLLPSAMMAGGGMIPRR
jgi:hypothetical protein